MSNCLKKEKVLVNNKPTDIILTGAGFTANFNAPLAKQMWELIYNSHYLSNSNRIRKMMLSLDGNGNINTDYEYFYELIINGQEFNEDEKLLFIQALKSAYRHLDNVLITYQGKNAALIQRVKRFLAKWLNDNNEMDKVFFTTNQDIFIERHYYHLGLQNNEETWLNNYPKHSDYSDIKKKTVLRRYYKSADNIIRNLKNKEEDEEWLIKIGSSETDKEIYDNFNISFYVKLHGSYDFIDVNNRPLILSGHNKKNAILGNEYYNCCYKLFLNKISLSKRLIIIGSGFRDEHINEGIKRALEQDTRLILITHDSYERVLDQLSHLSEKAENNIDYISTNGLSVELMEHLTENIR